MVDSTIVESNSVGRASFLYPFLDGAVEDPADLLADLARSAESKWQESIELRRTTLDEVTDEIGATACAIADRLRAGGRLFAFGNGGSAADAEAFVDQCAAAQPSLPAVSLVAEAAVLTALVNDIGVDAIFARQLAAHAGPGDAVVAFSTSGGSNNVLAAIDQCRKAGILTVGLAGYGGGALASRVDHCLAVRSQSVHRIQEAQAAIVAELIAATATALALTLAEGQG